MHMSASANPVRWPHPAPYSAAWSRNSVTLACRAALRKTHQKRKRRRRAVAKMKNNHQRFNSMAT